MVIGSWAPLHTYTHIYTQKKERKRKRKKREKKEKRSGERAIVVAAVVQRRKKRISKIVRVAHSTTDNVDYYHHRDTYTYYNTYAALA
jgi:hypothetical protein